MKPFIRSSKAGFTLVELIIVIAILAILAGVAIPVYSGYIKKANQAADLQLLSAVNTSFAAACAEVGIGSTDVSGAVLRVTDGCITGVSVSGFRAGVTPIAARSDSHGLFALLSSLELNATDARLRIGNAFQRYFGDNTTTSLKYYNGAGNFVFRNGVFEAIENGEKVTFITAYGTVNLSTDDLNTYYQSTFQTIGSEKLTTEIDKLSDSVIAANTYWLQSNEEFQEFWNSLEIDTSGMSSSEITSAKANALVLWAANGANKVDIDGILNGDLNNIDLSDDQGWVSNISAAYALMFAYANSSDNACLSIKTADGETKQENTKAFDDLSYDDALIAAREQYGPNAEITENSSIVSSYIGKYRVTYTTDPVYETVSAGDYFNNQTLTSLKDVSDLYSEFYQAEEFQSFIDSHGRTDLEGFLSALNIINSNVSDGAVDVTTIISGNYANLTEILIDILGS